MNINTRPLPGFMELLPGEQIEFNRIKNIIESEFIRYGFSPLDTPTIERSEVLLAKAGGETEKQIYRFEKGDNDLSLRFDLTIPLARFVADNYGRLVFPFRRYQIGKVYRGERPQHGRFREFYQCDIDIIGDDSLNIAYEAEMPAIIYSVFKKLDFGKFTIRINNRKILSGLLEYAGLKSVSDILRIIDKSEKISPTELSTQLTALGLSDKNIDLLKKVISIKGKPSEVITALRELSIDNPLFQTGITELEDATNYLQSMKIDSEYYIADMSIARGLDYYTGTIYETTLDEYPDLGSICSGGRYDNLASQYIDRKLPGVGISIGLTRLFDQLRENGLIQTSQKTTASVLVLPFDQGLLKPAFEVASKLRASGINIDILLEQMPIKKMFRYADRLGVPNVIVVGNDEVTSGEYTLQDMKTGDKQKMTIEAIVKKLQN